MCGITGFTGKAARSALRKMNDSLKHRGPDGEGFFVNDEVSLGMRRLAIIDLQTGDQPMYSEDRSVVVVFNGEIYNFRKLRQELAGRHKFLSQSDTEVIVHGYEEWGTAVFAKLNGMFGIALWDQKKKQLVLGRDRFGKKPLYYTKAGDNVVFGSEIKALLLHQDVKKQLSLPALGQYLTYEYVPSPATIYKDIYRLPAGSFLVWDGKRLQLTKYWDIRFHAERDNQSEDEYLSAFDRILEEAVAIRLVSDVPLGVFLSGGIDSSAIAYYAQKISPEKIKTFSIGFTDESFDESDYAALVASHLGTEHYQQIFSEKQVLDLLPDLTAFLDEPFGDASVFPTYLLSKFTREKVTVALAGDGGDELLYGYPTFQMHRVSRYYFAIPKFFRQSVIDPMIRLWPTSFDNITLEYGLKRFLASVDYEPWQRDLVWIGSFVDKNKQQLLQPAILKETGSQNTFLPLAELLRNVQGQEFLDQVSYLYLKTYLADDILFKADRAAMYASLEARAPFLDHRVVDLLMNLPPSLKMRGLRTKYLLKKLMSGKLPEEIINRKKKGFGIPVARWLLGELRPLAKEYLLDRTFLQRQGLFQPDYLGKLWQEHESHRKNHRKELWTLLMFQLWYRAWFQR